MSEYFSIRNNLIFQIEDDKYDEAFRNSIVNAFFNQYSSLDRGDLFYRLKEIMDVFGIEQTPSLTDEKALIDNKNETLYYFKNCTWNKLFDFVGLALEIDEKRKDKLASIYNRIFAMHGCRYRIINYNVVPIMGEMEINEIEKASTTGIDSIDSMIKEAIELLSVKDKPDYNAIVAKSSNALESMVLTIGKQNNIDIETLGKALNALKHQGFNIDEDFEKIIKSIYKYACNAGIRHGGTDNIVVSEEEAIYTLVVCSATINYLKHLYL